MLGSAACQAFLEFVAVGQFPKPHAKAFTCLNWACISHMAGAITCKLFHGEWLKFKQSFVKSTFLI